MRRIVIYHREWGIYLGQCIAGFSFWSKLDPDAQDTAITFESEDEAKECIAGWEANNNPAQFDYVLVESERYATIGQCTAAGLPSWLPQTMKSRRTWHGLED
jgi:hypothetical protein